MVVQVDIVDVIPEKRAEAIELLKKWAAVQPGTNKRILRPQTGATNKLIWVRHFESNVARAKALEQWIKSPERKAIRDETRKVQPWIPGSRVRHVYQLEYQEE